MMQDSELPAVLYHYTSNSAFLSIIRSRELRLSALSQSNDALEGQWFKHALKAECREQGVNQDRRSEIIDYFQFIRDLVMGYGFCLSKNRDQLSQWRGYADDGRGVAIGFDSSELLKLTQSASLHLGEGKIELKKVIYDCLEHRAHLAPIVRQLFAITRDLPLDAPVRLDLNSLLNQSPKNEKSPSHLIRSAVLQSIGSIFQFKGPAFQEENEWRILQEGMRCSEDGEPDKNNLTLEFFPAGSRIVPCRIIRFDEAADRLIKEVVLGPKNNTPWHVIDMAGHSAEVRIPGIGNSAASYR